MMRIHNVGKLRAMQGRRHKEGREFTHGQTYDDRPIRRQPSSEMERSGIELGMAERRTYKSSHFEGREVRGGTCALGYAAIQLAKALGCRVIATTHRQEKLPLLSGADEALLDSGELLGTASSVTKALELVGVKTLSDTLQCMEKGGIL